MSEQRFAENDADGLAALVEQPIELAGDPGAGDRGIGDEGQGRLALETSSPPYFAFQL